MAIVADDRLIINTIGIRFVERYESGSYGNNPNLVWGLRITYKGSQLNYLYPNEAQRNAQYEALRAAMTKKRGDQ